VCLRAILSELLIYSGCNIIRPTLFQVRVGFTSPVPYACIRYVSDPVNIALIVGLVVGLGGALFIVLIVIAIVYVVRRRRTSLKAR
jgi:hypothetical protein